VSAGQSREQTVTRPADRVFETNARAARCRAEQRPTDGMIRVMVRYGDVLALTYTGQLDLADKRAADYADFFLSRPVPRMGDRQNHGRSRRDAPRQLSRCHLVTRAGTGGTGRRGATAMAAARKAEALHHAARFGDRTVADRLAAL
jgi:hypothetical protein